MRLRFLSQGWTEQRWESLKSQRHVRPRLFRPLHDRRPALGKWCEDHTLRYPLSRSPGAIPVQRTTPWVREVWKRLSIPRVNAGLDLARFVQSSKTTVPELTHCYMDQDPDGLSLLWLRPKPMKTRKTRVNQDCKSYFRRNANRSKTSPTKTEAQEAKSHNHFANGMTLWILGAHKQDQLATPLNPPGLIGETKLGAADRPICRGRSPCGCLLVGWANALFMSGAVRKA